MGVYLGQSIYNDSQVTPEWVHDEIEKNGKGVFYTVIGTTTYNDTFDAYKDGKVVIAVKFDDVETEHATFYPLYIFDPDPDEGNVFIFARDIDNTFEYYNLHINGGWSSRYYKNIVTVDSQLDSSSHNPVENMAIAAELTEINNKITGDLNDIFLALASKGVTVPAGTGLDDVAGLIGDISTGPGYVPGLPNTYTPIEYATVNISTGGLIIDNLNITDENLYFEIDYKVINTPGVFNYCISVGSLDLRFNGSRIYINNIATSQYASFDEYRQITLRHDSDYKWYVNGVASGMSSNVFNTVTSVSLLRYNARGYLRRFRVYTKNHDVLNNYCDLIPCKDSNSNVGLYDLIQQRFFTNAGIT